MEKAREFQKNIYLCFIDYAKAFHYSDHSKLWETLKETGIPYHLTCLLRNLYAGQEATEPDMEQWTCLNLRKEFIKTVYYHPAYLIYMQSTPCKMPAQINFKLELRLPGEISTTSDKQKSYNKPRQCIKKQRHDFADKGPYRQSYGFSSSHIQGMRIGP